MPTRITVLTFHGLGEPPAAVPASERGYWVDRGSFERIALLVAGREDVRVTFDDGNLSDLTVALPVLVRHGLAAAFFVVASRIGAPGYLGRADLAELVTAGMEVGSHGMEHRSWRGLAGPALDDEIAGARAAIEEACGRPVASAACPFGEYDRRSLAALWSAGFRTVHTSDGFAARTASRLVARFTIHAGQGPDDAARLLRAPADRRRNLAGEARMLLKRLR